MKLRCSGSGFDFKQLTEKDVNNYAKMLINTIKEFEALGI